MRWWPQEQQRMVSVYVAHASVELAALFSQRRSTAFSAAAAGRR